MSTIHIFAFIVIIEPRMALKWKVTTSPARWPICLFPFLDYDSSLQRHTTRQAVLSELFFIGTSNLCLSHWGVIPSHPQWQEGDTGRSSKNSLKSCGWKKAFRGAMKKPMSWWPTYAVPSSSDGSVSQKDKLPHSYRHTTKDVFLTLISYSLNLLDSIIKI